MCSKKGQVRLGWKVISQWKVLLVASVTALAKYTAVERRSQLWSATDCKIILVQLYWIMKSFMNCTHQIKKNDMGDTCSTNEGEVHIGFCWGNRRERNDLEDLSMDGSVILNSNSRKCVWDMDWIDLAQVETVGTLLWKRRWTFRSHKLRANCWPAEQLLSFQEYLCCLELFKL